MVSNALTPSSQTRHLSWRGAASEPRSASFRFSDTILQAGAKEWCRRHEGVSVDNWRSQRMWSRSRVNRDRSLSKSHKVGIHENKRLQSYLSIDDATLVPNFRHLLLLRGWCMTTLPTQGHAHAWSHGAMTE